MRVLKYNLQMDVLLIAFLILTALINPTPALAHGNATINISPLPFSTLPKFPTNLKITTTEALNAKTGTVVLLDPSGKDILDNKIITVNGVTADIKPTIYKGQYQLNYQLLSLDGSSLEKSLTYTIINGKLFAGKPVTKKEITKNTKSKPILPLIFFFTLPLIYIIFVKLNSKK